MIWTHAGNLSLFGLAAFVLLIYFLRARNLHHDVSAVFLWEQLQFGHRTKLARFRIRLDLVLLAQLVGLALLVIATAGPGLRVDRAALTTMAVVIDGSVSMSGTTADGRSKEDVARGEALRLLETYPGTPVTVLQWSLDPEILAALGDDHSVARSAIAGFQANWTGDGTVATLDMLLESQQPSRLYEKVFLITDHAVAGLPASIPVQVVPISSDGNVLIDVFNVRGQPNDAGVVVFAGVRNDDVRVRETELRVSDGSSRVRLPLVLAPGERQSFVLPFPGARGVAYTAELTPRDGAPFDDVRYYALPQSMPRTGVWIGEDDPFLRAAIEVSGPTLWTQDVAAAQFVVVNGGEALQTFEGETGRLPPGNLFLVSVTATSDDSRSEEAAAVYEGVRAVAAGDPLLNGIAPDELRVDMSGLPNVQETELLPDDAVPLLASAGRPILLAGVSETGRWVALIPDLWATNLPLSIEFPLLVDNVLAYLVPRAESATSSPIEPGDAVDLAWAGRGAQAVDPMGSLVESMFEWEEDPTDSSGLRDAGGILMVDLPGFYEVRSSSGPVLLAANVALHESAVGSTLEMGGEADQLGRSEMGVLGLWPWFALAACVVLLAEAAVYHGVWSPGRRR